MALTKNQKEHKWEADDDSDNESLFTEKSLELRQVGCLFLLSFVVIFLSVVLLVGLPGQQCQGRREECGGVDNRQ